MKLLHVFCMVCYGLIAVTHAHMCIQAKPDPHLFIVTAANIALTTAHAGLVLLLFREPPEHGNKASH